MKLLRSLTDLPDEVRSGAVAVGNFDGVHLGHARIMRTLVEAAREVQGPAVALTFDPHPVRLLRPEQCPPPLTWTDRKAELLAELGVDAMVAYPTDHAFLQLSAQQFFDEILRAQLGARAVVEGPNFFFGHGRQGTIETLRQFAQQAGIKLEVVDPVQVQGQNVSSSRVRRLIGAGDVEAARAMLTRPYRVRGLVTHGAARGASIGFPTANVDAVDTLLPGDGVYAGAAETDGKLYAAAISLGPNPTFGEAARKLEAHLIGFSGALYGTPLEVDFYNRLRGVQPFEHVDQLTAQLALDVARTKEVFAQIATQQTRGASK